MSADDSTQPSANETAPISRRGIASELRSALASDFPVDRVWGIVYRLEFEAQGTLDPITPEQAAAR